MTTNLPDSDPNLAGTLGAIETLAASIGLSVEDALEAARTGQMASARTVTDAIDRAMKQATEGIRGALDPYVRVLKHGMPGACTCACPDCLEVIERHRAVPDGAGGREPVPCPCVEAGHCACPASAHLVASSCLESCPVLGPMIVSTIDEEADIVRNWVRARAQRRQLRRNARRAEIGRTQRRTRGDHAVEQYNDALRRMYKHAGLRLEARLERTEAIPATRRPKRTEGRGLTAEQFQEVARVAWTGGDDPDLDGLLVVFEVCTGARREGILELRTDGLDVVNLKVDLWEKAGETRWQDVQRELLAMLIEHVVDRHLAVIDPARWEQVSAEQVLSGQVRLPSCVPVFHYRPKRSNGTLTPRPVTRRRFNTLYDRVQEALPWADQHGLHGHDLRRTGSSWIERRFGRGVAKAWLGHADDVTGGYTRGTAEEIRAATDWLGSVVFGTSA
jgi:integrase